MPKKPNKKNVPLEDLRTRGLEGGDTRLATQKWVYNDELTDKATLKDSPLYYTRTKRPGCERPGDAGTVFLGNTMREGKGVPLGWCDDRHIVTIAGSRAGKGRSAIVPNLLLYPGPVVCIDPKGENATETADHRANVLGHDVYVLDPFGSADIADSSLLSYYDPIKVLSERDPEMPEAITAIADSMVVSSGSDQAHWDESARALIGAVIGHVKTASSLGNMPRSLPTVRRLLQMGDQKRSQELTQAALEEATELGLETYDPVTPHDALLHAMSHNTALDGIISGQAHRILSMAPEERGSVMSTADRHTKFLEGVQMPKVLTRAGRRKKLDLESLKTSKEPVTVYLCLPTRYMSTHARWLRLIISQIMSAVERTGTGVPACGYRILAVLDEFPVLGHLRAIESAVGFMAGFGLQIWAILQDLSQLQRDYPSTWETFLGNAGLKQFFGNTDKTTLEYMSWAFGETQVVHHTKSWNKVSRVEMFKAEIRSGTDIAGEEDFTSESMSSQVIKTPLMTPAEAARVFDRRKATQGLLFSGMHPVAAYRRNYDEMKENGELSTLMDR